MKVIKSPGALGALSMIPGLGAISGIVGAVGNIASAAKGEGSIVDKLGAIAGATGNAMSQLKIKGAEKFGNFAAGLQDKIGAVKNVISNVKEGGLSNIQGIVGSLKGLKGAFGRGGAPPQDDGGPQEMQQDVPQEVAQPPPPPPPQVVQAPPPVAQQPAYQPKAQPQPQGRPTQQEIQAAIEHLKKKFPFGVPDGSNPQKMIMDRVMEQRQQSNNAGTSQQTYNSFGRTQSSSNVPPPPPAAPAPPVATPAPSPIDPNWLEFLKNKYPEGPPAGWTVQELIQWEKKRHAERMAQRPPRR